jgi:hypothetical protein
MSNYTKSTNFATKDNLTPGDPLKIVRGTEIDTEYNNIATAIATKTDNASAAITGGTINATTIGATTASTGAFSTLSATGAITSTLATGTAPLVIASTTKVANLNVDSLDGADWASPAALGSTTPAAVSATTLTTSSTVTFNGGTANGVTYLNGSKVLTSGSALTFDGTNLATTGDISLGAGKLLKYSSTSYITPENNVSGAEISTTGVITFLTGSGTPTERARIDSSGNLLLGTTSSFSARRFRIYGSQASAASTSLQLTNSTTGDGASDGLTLEMDGVNGYLYNYESGPLIFGTANTERARIDSSGNLLVGTTSTSTTDGAFALIGSGAINSYLAVGHKNGSNSGSDFLALYYNGTQIGGISQSGTTAVLFNTTSDQRLKENIVDAPEFGSVIDSIKVRSYNWKADGSHQRAGFVAQELVTVAPEAVHQPEDTEEMMAVDYSKLVPMLVKEIQSLRKRLADAGI